jgi:glycogen operon protein
LILHGDELGRTQGGNNNAWCHDDETTWVDWSGRDDEWLAFVQRVVGLRRHRPLLRRLQVDTSPGGAGRPELPDVALLGGVPPGATIAEAGRALDSVVQVFLNGRPFEGGVWSGGDLDERDLLVILNTGEQTGKVALPGAHVAHRWSVLLDTSDELEGHVFAWNEALHVTPRSLLLLEAVRDDLPADPHAGEPSRERTNLFPPAQRHLQVEEPVTGATEAAERLRVTALPRD